MVAQTLDSSDLRGRPLRFTGRGWALLAGGVIAALIGELLGSDAFRFLGIALAALPVFVLLVRLVIRPRLTIERNVYPRTVAAGDRLRVVTELRNQSVFGVEPSSYADIVTGADRAHIGGVLPAIATRLHRRESRSRRRIAYSLNKMRRGVRQVGPLLLENIDGLGLTRRVIRLGEPLDVEVWPQIHDADRLDVPALRSGSEVDVSLGRGGEADDVITREYRHGDPLRRVHWKATARAGELRIRQEEHHSEALATVVLDTSFSDQPWYDDAFELSISVAASVAVRLHELGFDTELITSHPTDSEPDDFRDYRIPAGSPLDPMMHRLTLLHWAAREAHSNLDDVMDRIGRATTGPLVYVGRGYDTDAAHFGGYGNPAIAVICKDAGEQDPLEAPWVRAGWEVIVMNAGARDPWASLQHIGVADSAGGAA